MKLKKSIKKLLSLSSLGKKFIDERYPFSSSKLELQKLKNKFEGKRCFIIGNGPSLNKIDLNFLKEEYSFGVNGIFYKTEESGFKPTFYVVEDTHVMRDNRERINAYKTEYKFFPTRFKKFFKKENNNIFFNMNEGYYNETSDFYCKPRFSLDASKRVFCGQSVTMINLQLAYHLGFHEVYLIGMDHKYTIPDSSIIKGETIESAEDDPNHFHPEYFGKGKKWHDPHLDRVEKTYSHFKKVYEAEGRVLKNATIGGSLEIFERVDFYSLFK